MRHKLPLLLLSLTCAAPAYAQIQGDKPLLMLDTGGHTASVVSVFFSPDGKQLLTAARDNTIRIWDVATGQSLRVLRPPQGAGGMAILYTAALTPDGKTIAVGGKGDPARKDGLGTIYLISLATGSIEQVLRGHGAFISALAFSPDGKQLASGSADKTIRLWSVATGQCVQTLEGHTDGILRVTFAPNGRRLASTSHDGTARLWSVGNGRSEAVLQGPGQPVRCIGWSPDGKTLATGSYDQSIRLWGADGTAGRSFEKLGNTIGSVNFTPDSAELLVTRGDQGSNVCSILALATGNERVRFTGHNNTVNCGTLSADGSLAATCGGNDHETFVWKAADGSIVSKLAGKGKGLWAAGWSKDGAVLAWGNKVGNTTTGATTLERAFRMADLEFTSAPDRTFGRAQHVSGPLSLEKTGRTTLTIRRDGNVAATFETAKLDILHCFTLVKGDRAAVGSGHAFGLIDSRTGKAINSLYGHSADVLDVSPSPNGRYLLSCSHDQTLRVWSLEPEAKELVGVGVQLRLEDGLPTVMIVFPGGAAATDGRLKAKDRISAVEGQNGQFVDVTMVKKIEEVTELMRGPAGTRVRLKVIASGKQEAVVYELTRAKLGYEDSRTSPLLSFFFADNDWIIGTPEGYYAASVGGEKLMGWLVNTGPDQMPIYYPAAQFRKSLYRPDIIKRVLEAGSAAKALALIDKESGETSKALDLTRVLPPKVAIVSPARSGQRVPRAEIEVQATASSSGEHPVTTFRLLLDDRPYEGQSAVKKVGVPKVGETRESWTVQLTPGKHRLQVLADSAVSQGVSEVVEVLYLEEVQAPVELPNLYVLAIGVAAYPAEALKLNYSASDAEAIAKVFQDKGKPLFKKVEAKVLTDKQASRAEILKGLGWLRKEMTSKDFAIVFFSGHGDKDSDGSLYFLPYDVDINDLPTTCVGADQFKKMLVALPGKVIALLDACHSGGIDGGKRKGNASLTDDLVRDLVTDENGLIVMCSSTGREFSLENNEFRHSNFTQALIEGLSGKAAQSGDAAVYLHHLDSYVTDRVKQLSQGKQHPVTAKPSSIRSFPLSKP